MPGGAGNDGKKAGPVFVTPDVIGIVTPDVIGRLLMAEGKRLPGGAGNDGKKAGPAMTGGRMPQRTATG